MLARLATVFASASPPLDRCCCRRPTAQWLAVEALAAGSAHSLRAKFITYAHLRGSSDRAVAHQTRHRSLASLTGYIRVHDAWVDNAATELNL